jgi:DNA-binding XRE family transcriptional regulator
MFGSTTAGLEHKASNHIQFGPKTGVFRFICTDEIYKNNGDTTMKRNQIITTPEVPLHVLLRRRRGELSMFQSQIAEALHVTPECIAQWECGRRRMELSKLPRIALALQLDAKELCAKALAEFHPLVYAALFGAITIPAKVKQVPV